MKRLSAWVGSKIRAVVYSRVFLFLLGVTIGATFLFVWYEGRVFYSEYLGFNVHGAMASAAVHVMPQGSPAGQAGGNTGKETSPSLEEIVSKVYQLESSSGRNDSCHRKGLHNDFGFGVYGDREDCYKTTDEVRKLVEVWFADKLEKGFSLEASVCGYNTGKFIAQCDYLSRFKSI